MTFTWKTFRKREEMPEAVLAVFLERTLCSLKVYLSFSPLLEGAVLEADCNIDPLIAP